MKPANPQSEPIPKPITLDESKRLIELEIIIEAGRKTFIKVGTALAEIRDGQLYIADFKNFGDYCLRKWGFKHSYAYQLIRSAELVKELPAQVSTIVESFNPGQVRELFKVPKEQRVAVVQTAITKSKAAGRPLTAKDIQTAALPNPAPAEPACVRIDTPEPVTTTGKTPEEVPICYPRAQTKRKLEHWYWNTTKQKRGQFLNHTFTIRRPVEVEDKAKFKQRFDQWFENSVSESGECSE